MKKALIVFTGFLGSSLLSVATSTYTSLQGLIVAFVLGRLFSHVEAWAYPAIVGVLLLMVAKECVDYYLRDEQFDFKDIAAGLVGSVIGVLMCLV